MDLAIAVFTIAATGLIAFFVGYTLGYGYGFDHCKTIDQPLFDAHEEQEARNFTDDAGLVQSIINAYEEHAKEYQERADISDRRAATQDELIAALTEQVERLKTLAKVA